MVPHQSVDLRVLPLLNLVQFSLAPQIQLIAQRPHLALVLLFNLRRSLLERCPVIGYLFIMCLQSRQDHYYTSL